MLPENNFYRTSLSIMYSYCYDQDNAFVVSFVAYLHDRKGTKGDAPWEGVHMIFNLSNVFV